LWDVISTLVSDGTTVMLTTQYLEEADRLADTIVVIDRGRVAAEGTPAQLKARLGSTTIALRFADGDTAAAAIGVLSDLHPSRPVDDPLTVQLPLFGGARTVRDILNRLDAAGHEVGRLDLHEPTLDDVFLSLTGAHS
jgi:ABC-2 type transport system ATP-binding protein